MADLEEPLLPSSESNKKFDDAVLDQIRTLLVDAGVTSPMLDLPDRADDPPPPPSESPPSVQPNHSDILDGVEHSLDVLATPLTSVLGAMAKRSDRNPSIVMKGTEHQISEDIYNLWWVSKNWSSDIFYAIITVSMKFFLYGVVLDYIFMPGGYRQQQLDKEGTVGVTVTLTQLVLIPVAVGITEELMISMDILSKTGWAPLENRPHATKLKYRFVSMVRLLDGLTWVFLISSLMVYATDVLSMFLNFAGASIPNFPFSFTY